MNIKAIVIVFVLFLMQFFSSCCKKVKFYDFSEMTVELSNNPIIGNDSLFIELFADDLEYISTLHSDFAFSSAMAISCDHGYGGMKHPLEKIEIVSDSDFSDVFKEGDNLISLFKVNNFKRGSENEYVLTEDIVLGDIVAISIKLLITEKPQIEMNHRFTIKLTKSNKEEIIVQTKEIIWQ